MIKSYDHFFERSEIKEISSVEILEEVTKSIGKFSQFWGISMICLFEAIEGRIEAIHTENKEMEGRLDLDNEWKERYASSSPSDTEMDAQISQMFNTLKN
jgi:hypothetical protein